MKVIASWSGGKDSCLALYKAIQSGHEVKALLNFVSEEYKRCCFHGIPPELIQAQASSLGIPLVQHEMPVDMAGYEKEFVNIVSRLRDEQGIEAVVFGDIYLDEHKLWVEKVCRKAGVDALEPIWNVPVDTVINEFISLGFKTKVVSAKADILGEDFVGSDIDKAAVAELKKNNVCVCGEGGEFHTFVYDGPLFNKSIEVTNYKKLLVDGFWKHWFLDIQV
ncbi:MAG TPA: diphthine--ammonia ligase [Elusimicrobia bacterium]|nr:MAG: hypothetical protein A2278_07385 [Elusimicrobia bacterium RIFOXYA12_FULL_49_49]OGS09754.1 MAG: hypothetical protein A2386_03765 [Elusimicrobia bacterium RIFOXYB1_FULL_48_9]OGS10155.1 MAG: hypothetical protein A2204_03860 [Elusimicrobia bacterium RIFOXYA1_FULL_47_7]OGS16111.1 MAG: hypothetical protein A2251_02880 [Elusimicrobia bacterium RIFOXYA2_FULL_47_53]OGS26737.1 MAG: hypothetical protein A2339_03930 [Elusimicrobia bacterium RIFOXYB12_FULL_50_12]OGS30137.1 MAG: hypothetical protein